MSSYGWRVERSYHDNHARILEAIERLPRPCVSEIAIYAGLHEDTVNRHLQDIDKRQGERP